MALTDAERKALCLMLKAELRDEIKQDMMLCSDRQAEMPHTGNAGPSGDPGEETNKMLSAIADKLSTLHIPSTLLRRMSPKKI